MISASDIRSISLLVLASLFHVGCAQQPKADVPRYAITTGYGVPEFKDSAPSNVQVGAGDFPLSFVDAQGNSVDLTRYRGKQKVVLIVLRGATPQYGGAFCPSCLAQTSSLLVNREEFSQRDVELLVVFPGPTERIGEFFQLAKKQTPGEPANNFLILVDRDCAACERLGIRDDLAKPSTYILDKKGNVIYAYVGATSADRPSVKAVLEVLDKAE